jgi:hypothetical protein
MFQARRYCFEQNKLFIFILVMSSHQIYAEQELSLRSRTILEQADQFTSNAKTSFSWNLPNLSNFTVNSKRILTIDDLGGISGATVQVGTTTTLPAGNPATVTNSGTLSNAVFNFAIPQGPAGTNGTNGTNGAAGPAGPPGPGLSNVVANDPLCTTLVELGTIANPTATLIQAAVLNGAVWNPFSFGLYFYPITYSRLNNMMFICLTSFSITSITGPEPTTMLLGLITNTALRPLRNQEFPVIVEDLNTQESSVYQIRIQINGRISLNSPSGEALTPSFGLKNACIITYDLTVPAT